MGERGFVRVYKKVIFEDSPLALTVYILHTS